MNNIYNINNMHNDNTSDNNSASITKIIRPGSDEYNEIHTGEKINTHHEIDYADIIENILKNDTNINDFINLYINKVNEKIVSGKVISSKAYNIYNIFKHIK